jgi:hypothetical protein
VDTSIVLLDHKRFGRNDLSRVSVYGADEERSTICFRLSNFIIENKRLYSNNRGGGEQRNRDHRKEVIEVKR